MTWSLLDLHLLLRLALMSRRWIFRQPSDAPMLHFFLHLISRGAQPCTKARPSDLPTTIGCTDAIGIGSSGATDFSRTRPIQSFFSSFFVFCFAWPFTSSWDLEIF